jgi:3-oxoacyl-[acyl-carrier protein] reductase
MAGMRIALVTGTGNPRGIGPAIARRLAAEGLGVVVHGWGDEPGALDALAAEVGGPAVMADFAEPGAPARVVQACVAAFGRLDVVVANHARSSNVALADLTAQELDLTYAVNVRASLLLAQELARRPEASRLVLFTSGQYHGAMADELPYIASKGALHQLTKSLAIALAPATVNTVDPGPTDTGYADADREDEVARLSPSGRWGAPEDAARLVSWLVSEEAEWVTGQVIASDGGWSARPRAG